MLFALLGLLSSYYDEIIKDFEKELMKNIKKR